MPWFDFFWTDARIEKLAQHDVTPEEFEEVVQNPEDNDVSISTGRPMAFGSVNGRRIACVYEMIDDITVLPITAYPVEE